VEVPSVAWKEDLPSVSAEEPAIAEAAVVEKEAETTHSIEPVAELVAGEPASGKEEGHEPPIVANAGAVTPVEEPRVEGDAAPGADGRELPTAVD
jgi:hypothetical protein